MTTLYSASFPDFIREVKAGRLEPKKALIWATRQAAGKPGFLWKGYFELVSEVLPLARWNPDGDELDVPGGIPTVWKSPADYYEWANRKCGEAFAVGAWVEQYIRANTPEQRDDIERKTQERWERIHKNQRLINDEKKPIREAAKESGCSHTTARRDANMEQKNLINERRSKKTASQMVSARQVYLPAEASVAARKIIAKLGDEFAGELAMEILKMVKEEAE